MPLRLSVFLCLAVACSKTPVLAADAAETVPAPGKPIALPSQLVEDRFFVSPVSSDGQKLELFTDTGGGLFLMEETAQRLKLAMEELPSEESKTGKFTVVRLPGFQPGAGIPPVTGGEGMIPVAPAAKASRPPKELMGDGMLGQSWFAERVWTFDYPGGRLWWRAPGDVPGVDASHRVSLGFPVNRQGGRAANFPRIQVTVDGETLDLLFDTGATVLLTDAALQALGDGRPAARATSFITRSTFERWHQRHPDWRVIEDADKNLPGAALIEVPEVEVAGYKVGPVGFTTRPDKNFHEYMSRMMDKQVEGALGGSALHFFRVTVDYPNAVAAFEKP